MTIPPLPSEVLVAVLRLIDPLEVVRCKAVCRHWRLTIEGSTELIYYIWLRIHGKVDGPMSVQQMGFKERLQTLLRHEQAWIDLRPSRRDSVNISLDYGFHLLGFDTVEIMTFPQDEEDFTPLDFDILKLPSMLSNKDQPQFTLEDVSASIKFPQEDPDPYSAIAVTGKLYNLHILCDRRGQFRANTARDHLHFQFFPRMITDINEQHPLSQKTVIDSDCVFSSHRSPEIYSYRFGLEGNLFWMNLFSEAPSAQTTSTLAVWDWMTGDLMMRLVIPNSKSIEESNLMFTFISPTSLVHLSQLEDKSAGRYEWVAHLYEFMKVSERDVDGCPIPLLVRVFELPAVKCDAPSFGCTSSFEHALSRNTLLPMESTSNDGEHAWPLPTDKPFQPAEYLCEFHVKVRGSSDQSTLFSFVTRIDMLSCHYSECRVTWEDWGPQNTVLIASRDVSSHHYFEPSHETAGTRIAFEVANTEGFSQDLGYAVQYRWDLTLVDLNPRQSRRRSHSIVWPREAQAGSESRSPNAEGARREAAGPVGSQHAPSSSDNVSLSAGPPQFILIERKRQPGTDSLMDAVRAGENHD
ncbi:hypothetical protein DL93DRAFT_2159921 [Clavulina sp. PMI_390]|nr:hypothetical protein DL93DRAFT_2159921 [Clavulina sp. PMI_390]